MVSIGSLEHEIQRRRAEADSKHKLAVSLNASADSHQGVDDTRAKLDRESAIRAQEEAQQEEQQAGIYEAEVYARHKRAEAIDKQIESLKANHEKQLRDLEAKRDSILNS